MSDRCCIECARPLTGKQRLYCSQRCSRRRWRRENVERDRATSLRWKREHPERCKAIDAAAARRRYPNVCSRCGAFTSRDDVCRRCEQSDGAARRRERIAAMWRADASLRQIAAALSTSSATIANTIDRMRSAGWDVPYRYRRRAKDAA